MKNRRKRSLFAIGVIVAYILSVVAIQLASTGEKIRPEEFPEMCPDNSLNCSMIGPNSYRSNGITELRFNSSLETVMSESRDWVDSQPRTEIIGEWHNQTHSVFTSLLFRFQDDFVVKGFCEEGFAVIHVYSQSRLGISDIGANKHRVSSFASHMSSVEMATSDCVMG